MFAHLRRTAAFAALAAVALALVPVLIPLRGAPAAVAHAPPGRYEAIDAYVRDRMAATGTPGLAYAVVGPGGPLHRRAWGVDGNGEPVTPATPFLWGSVAKPVMATAVLALVEAGRLGLDDRVVDHLPGFRFGGPAHAAGVTVRHLLEHTSGLPPAAGYAVTDCHGSGCPRPADRLADLADLRPIAPPGAAYAYTSAARLLAGAPAPDGRASAAPYLIAVWGVTGVAVALALAVARTVFVIRRPSRAVSPPRRVAAIVGWWGVGLLPGIGLLVLGGLVPLRQVWTWTPDVFLALCAAAAAGVVLAVLRLVAAVRPRGDGRGGA